MMLAEAQQGEIARGPVARSRAEGAELVGPDGLLSGLTRRALETALEEELTDHLGYPPHDPAGNHSGNSRNGTRTKTVLTEILMDAAGGDEATPSAPALPTTGFLVERESPGIVD